MRLGILGETDYLIREPDEFDASPEASVATIEKVNAAAESMLCVAVDDASGELIGWAAGHGNTLRRRRHAALVVLGVARAHWGKGVARALMGSLIDWTTGAGITRLELTVDSRNTAAIALYLKLGFRVDGLLREVAVVRGEPIDDYQMALLIK